VRVIILIPQTDDIDEAEWLRAAAGNPAFDFPTRTSRDPRAFCKRIFRISRIKQKAVPALFVQSAYRKAFAFKAKISLLMDYARFSDQLKTEVPKWDSIKAKSF